MDLCDISMSWEVKSSLSDITKFTFKEQSDENDFASPSPQSLEEDLEGILGTRASVSVSCDVSKESNSCLMRISCKNVHSSVVNGLSIISECRRIELTHDTDGYLTSVKGNIFTGSLQTDDSSPNLYVCSCSLKDGYSHVNVKFLSLGQRTSFTLKGIVINLTKKVNDSLPAMGTFDMDKLMKNVAEMGDSVSENAKAFLKTLGHHQQNIQQNQIRMMASLQHQASNNPMAPSLHQQNFKAGSSPRNPVVAEMFSRLESMVPPRPPLHALPVGPSQLDIGSSSGNTSHSQSNPAACPFLAGKSSDDNGISNSETDGPSIPLSMLTAFMGNNPTSNGPIDVQSMSQLFNNFSSGAIGSAKSTENEDRLSAISKESLQVLSAKIEESTQSFSNQLETFRQHMMLLLEAQTSDFEERLSSMENKLQLILDHLETKSNAENKD